jgi:uncharacterized membrane protein YeaQ/YmgE (transglycosylase-associated protein family)
MLGAILLGLVAGYIGRLLTPGRGPRGCLSTTAIGIVGSLVGYFIFTEGLGIGDSEVFDFGGLPGAVIGVAIVLLAYRSLAGRRDER